MAYVRRSIVILVLGAFSVGWGDPPPYALVAENLPQDVWTDEEEKTLTNVRQLTEEDMGLS
jgi:hypothetical protein